MNYCTNCGIKLEGGNFCVNCGAAVETVLEQKNYNQDAPKAEPEVAVAPKCEPAAADAPKCESAPAPEAKPTKMGLNVKMLVWSIIDIVFCSQTFGIIALVFTILAAETTSRANGENYLQTSKILNIAGVIYGAIVLSLVFFYIIFIFLLSALMALGSV